MQALIDHTSLHALSPRAAAIDPEARTLSLLHLADDVLLADQLWLSNTEDAQVLGTSRAVLDALADHGLGGTSSRSPARLIRFTPNQFRAVLRRAASWLAEDIATRRLGIFQPAQLQAAAAYAGKLTPFGIEARDYPGITEVVPTWDSQSRTGVIDQALTERGFLSTAAPFLMSQTLHAWLSRTVRQFPDRNDKIYDQVNLLSRTYINRSLALACAARISGGEKGLQPCYLPSYYRGLAMQHYLPPPMRARQALVRGLWRTLLKARLYGVTSFGEQGLAQPVPLMGAFLVASLPTSITYGGFLDALSMLRDDESTRAVRAWLRGSEGVDVGLMVSALERRFRVSRSVFEKMKVNFSVVFPGVPRVSIDAEADVSRYASVPLNIALKWAPRRRAALALAGYIGHLLRERFSFDVLVERTQTILRSRDAP